MNHMEFFSQIKAGDIKSVYLFHGEEEYIKDEALNALISAVVPDMVDLNVNILENPTLSEVFSACESVSFLGGARVVIVKTLFKDKEAKELAGYLSEIPKDTVLVFCLRSNADSRNAIVKKIRELGCEVSFAFLSEIDAIKWVIKECNNFGCSIDRQTASFFVNTVGRDMLSIKNELEKVAAYAQGSEITKQMVSYVVISNVEYKIYIMYDYFVNGKFKDGFFALETLISDKAADESIGIAGYFVRCLKNTLIAYDGMKKGMQTSKIASDLKVNERAARGICANAKKFSRNQLLDGIFAFSNVITKRITGASTTEQALQDAIISTFIHIK